MLIYPHNGYLKVVVRIECYRRHINMTLYESRNTRYTHGSIRNSLYTNAIAMGGSGGVEGWSSSSSWATPTWSPCSSFTPSSSVSRTGLSAVLSWRAGCCCSTPSPSPSAAGFASSLLGWRFRPPFAEGGLRETEPRESPVAPSAGSYTAKTNEPPTEHTTLANKCTLYIFCISQNIKLYSSIHTLILHIHTQAHIRTHMHSCHICYLGTQCFI